MKKNILDNFIILYNNDSDIDFISTIKDINDQESQENIWQFLSLNNIKNTDHIVNQKGFVLPISDKLFSFMSHSISMEEQLNIKKNNLKYKLNQHAFTCIEDYLNTYELSTKKIKEWLVYEQISKSQFHDDTNKDGLKHFYTVIVALNDGYVGGDIYFENRIGNDPIKMCKGDILIYPSNSKYKHMETEIISGVKYSAIAYF